MQSVGNASDYLGLNMSTSSVLGSSCADLHVKSLESSLLNE